MVQPLVSVIVRTCQRPEVLRVALCSLENQTYKNLEVVVVEDGDNVSEELLKKEFSNLNYIYKCTGEKVGRSRVGNIALELAGGEYLNFLDDDDAFLPEHIESLVRELIGGKERVAYSIAEERQIVVKSTMPYLYNVKRKTIRYHQCFNRMLLYCFSYLPIQCVMFHKSLFEELGGFDEKLDNLEDWDLWVRYSTKTDFAYIDKVTSYYHVPYKNEIKKKRLAKFKSYYPYLYCKFENYKVESNVASLNRDVMYIIREYKTKGLIRYLRMFFRAVFYGER